MNNFIQIIIIALILALDAFSVSIALGVKSRNHNFKEAALISSFFGGFQAFMPLLGWLIGKAVKNTIGTYTDWIAFILLAIIGLKMIYEGFKGHEDEEKRLSIPLLTSLAIATSIDALLVGSTLALLSLPIGISVVMIGVITTLLSALGYYSGKHIGKFFENRIEIIGGIALILLGVKFLIF